ncbi:MAG: YceI family protein [Bacteroidales bacterium]
MKKISFLLAAMVIATGLKAQTTKWNFDNSHSSVSFEVSHMVVSDVEGSFKKFSGNVLSDKPDFTDAKIDFTIEVGSINTDNADRDNHLKSADFFDAANHPEIKFKSVAITKVQGNKYKMVGNLTMRGVTRSVSLDMTYGGTVTDPYKNTRAGFKITGKVNRQDFGLSWSKAMETGGLVVGDEVSFTGRVEIVKAQ